MLINQVVIVAVVLVVLLAAQGVYYLVVYFGERQRHELRRRLQSLSDEPSDQRGAGLLRARRIARTPGLDRLLRVLPGAERVEQILEQTDLTWTVAMVLGLGILFAAVLTVLLLFVMRQVWVAVITVPLGLAVPFLLVLNARMKRSQKISEQLPEALEMMMRSLQVGHGISAAFKLVAEELPPPVAVEFGRCFEEQRFGVDFREAVQNMTERVPGNLDLKIFAVSVIVQRETGGNLIEVLDKIASTIRERYKFYGKLRALTAEGRTSGYILGGLPFFCLGAVYVFNPNYLVPLAVDPLGRLIALGGIAIWGLGVFWMSRMVKVDY